MFNAYRKSVGGGTKMPTLTHSSGVAQGGAIPAYTNVIDLGEPKRAFISAYGSFQNNYGTSLTIQVSNDGTNWTNLSNLPTSGSLGYGLWCSNATTEEKYQYYRAVMNKSGGTANSVGIDVWSLEK